MLEIVVDKSKCHLMAKTTLQKNRENYEGDIFNRFWLYNSIYVMVIVKG